MQKRITLIFSVLLLFIGTLKAQKLPSSDETLKALTLVNNHFMSKYEDCTQPSNVGKVRPSNIWTRGVYYEGLMALYSILPSEKYYEYATKWGNFHQWGFNGGSETRNADNQCAGQTYCDIYSLCKDAEKLRKTQACMEMLLNTRKVDDWTWIDAIQMAMPALAKMGSITNNRGYYEKMWQMYSCTRNTLAGHGLYNPAEGLWWRDKDFLPPYKEPNGRNCYWSRGNGWVYAALVRVMDTTPKNEIHRSAYIADFLAMSKALKKCQRSDGFWNVSLHDADHFGGKETSGTALFVYGMSWGVRKGLLPRNEYLPIIAKAWNAILKDAVHQDGALGYVQGTGKEPKDSQPVTYDKIPDFEDFGTGCFLLAGSEVYKLQ